MKKKITIHNDFEAQRNKETRDRLNMSPIERIQIAVAIEQKDISASERPKR